MDHKAEDCIQCCCAGTVCYKYEGDKLKLTKIPLSAYKRNGLQDAVFSENGGVSYICKIPKTCNSELNSKKSHRSANVVCCKNDAINMKALKENNHRNYNTKNGSEYAEVHMLCIDHNKKLPKHHKKSNKKSHSAQENQRKITKDIQNDDPVCCPCVECTENQISMNDLNDTESNSTICRCDADFPKM